MLLAKPEVERRQETVLALGEVAAECYGVYARGNFLRGIIDRVANGAPRLMRHTAGGGAELAAGGVQAQPQELVLARSSALGNVVEDEVRRREFRPSLLRVPPISPFRSPLISPTLA